MKKVYILPLICFLFNSCIDPDETPMAPFTHIPLAALWTEYTERKITYKQEQEILNIPNSILVSSQIYSQNWELKRVSFTKAFANAIPPVDLWVHIELLDRDIIEVEILKCELNLHDSEYDLLNTLNIQASEYKKTYDEKSFSSGKYKGNFIDERTFIVNNSITKYFTGFSFGIKEMPFDCYKNDEINIDFSIKITDSENQIKIYDSKVLYKRIFLEKRGGDRHGEIWEEINFDEWQKNIKK